MNNEKIVELLKVLKKIYVCEMLGANETFYLVQKANMNDLNAFLEENGVNTLDIIESCYRVSNVMKTDFNLDKTVDGVKQYFEGEGLDLSDNEAKGIYEKYLKEEQPLP